MPDYQSNSKKIREASAHITPPKNIERVTVNEVIVKKKGIGRRFRDLFIEADFRTVAVFVAMDVLLPAAKNMFLDAVNRGSERMMYGEAATRRRGFTQGPRMIYNNPVNRSGFGGSPLRHAPSVSPDPRDSRRSRDDLILSTREEAELVLERMNDLIDAYQIASLADLNELIGQSSSHVDNKWGWTNLGGVQIRQIREGYLIDLPPAEPI